MSESCHVFALMARSGTDDVADMSKCSTDGAILAGVHMQASVRVPRQRTDPINLCNCGFGLRLVRKALFSAHNIVCFSDEYLSGLPVQE